MSYSCPLITLCHVPALKALATCSLKSPPFLPLLTSKIQHEPLSSFNPYVRLLRFIELYEPFHTVVTYRRDRNNLTLLVKLLLSYCYLWLLLEKGDSKITVKVHGTVITYFTQLTRIDCLPLTFDK